MGFLVWVASSLFVFAASRLIPLGRAPGWRREAFFAVAAGVAAGVTATALDFGGWKEADPLAAAFAALFASSAVAIHRLVFRPPDGQGLRRIEK